MFTRFSLFVTKAKRIVYERKYLRSIPQHDKDFLWHDSHSLVHLLYKPRYKVMIVIYV